MGTVSKVKIKDSRVGGSAFTQKRSKGLFGVFRKSSVRSKTNKLSERSKTHYYALKSIQLDRVSDIFVEELRNEGM